MTLFPAQNAIQFYLLTLQTFFLKNRNSFYFVPSSSVTALPRVPTQGGTSPVILSYEGNATALVSAEENSTSLSVANLLVYDLETSPLSYSIVGGVDADLFKLNTSSVTQVTLGSGKEVNATSTAVDWQRNTIARRPHRRCQKLQPARCNFFCFLTFCRRGGRSFPDPGFPRPLLRA